MSYQVPPRDALLQQSMTDYTPSYEYSGHQEDAVIIQKGPAKGGFVRRIIAQPDSGLFSADETNAMTFNSTAPGLIEGDPQSGCVVVNFQDRTDFYGMEPQSSEDGSMQNLKYIINEAKRAEGKLFTSGENYEENDNYIKIKDEELEQGENYGDNDMEFTKIPSKIRKTSNQALEIDLTEESIEKDLTNEFITQETKASTVMNTEGLTHSKSSYLTGSVRYSKMPEEEAASIFEQRRKELLGNLLQKGKRKNLRIFQDNDTNKGVGSPDGHIERSPGFVIYNTRKPSVTRTRNVESPIPAMKAVAKTPASRKSVTTMRHKPSSTGVFPQTTTAASKKDVAIPVNKFSAVKPKTAIKKEPSRDLNKETRPTMKKEEPSNMISVDWKTLKYGINRDINKNNKRQSEDVEDKRHTLELTKTQESETMQESVERDTYSKPSLGVRNQGIWAEIEELDQQIQQLEESKLAVEPVSDERIYQQRGWQNSHKENKAVFDKKTRTVYGVYDDDETMNPKSNDKTASSQLDGIISDRYKLDADEFLIAGETENVYKRYPVENPVTESPRIYHRKSPVSEEIGYARSHRERSGRKSHNHYEYLYQRALEKKEARQTQHENRQRERETAELLKCTFSPTIRAKSIEYMDDFETRTKDWQSRKERKLQEIENMKYEKEMSECTFFPNRLSGKPIPTKFDSEEFYNRNMEWKRDIENRGSKRQEEFFKLLSVPSEKSEYNPPSHPMRSTYSRGLYVQRSTERINDPPLSGRSYSRKQSQKSTATPGKIKTMTLVGDSSLSRLKPYKTQDSQMLKTVEDNKRYESTKSRPSNYESVELLDILKRVVTSKSEKSDGFNRSRGPSQSPQKTAKNNRQKVSKAEYPTVSTTLAYNLPVRNSRNGSSEVPSLFSDLTPNAMKNNPDNLVVKNNKYYVTRKLNQATSPKNSQQIHTSDRDLLSVGSIQSPKQSLQTDNSEAMMYESTSRADQENKAFKRKPLSGRPQKNLRTSPDVYEAQEQIPVERIPLAAKHFNRNSGDSSSKNQPDYSNIGIENNGLTVIAKKSNSKESVINLEKKFMGVMNQQNYMGSPIDQLKTGTNSSLNDDSLTKRRRMNFSLY